MPRLIFTVTTDLSYDQRMQRICRSLSAAGYNVLLVGRELPQSRPLEPEPYQQHRLKCRQHKGKLFYFEFMLRLGRFLRQHPADAYCAIDLDTALPVCLAAQRQGKPFIYDAHEYFTEMIEVTGRPLVKKFWKSIERYIMPRASLAYTVTSGLARLYEQEYGVPVSVIRNVSMAQPALEPAKTGAEPYMIYQGAVNEGRGLEALLEAMEKLNMRLYICGKGDVLPQLQAQAEKTGLRRKVTFTGYLLPGPLRELTQGAWLGFNLLENKGLSYYYSLANKFFDYVQAGVPQLCADFPEYRALNREYEVAELLPLNATAIVAAVQRLQEDPQRYRHLQEQCRQARLHWTWQEEEKKLLSLYQQTVPL